MGQVISSVVARGGRGRRLLASAVALVAIALVGGSANPGWGATTPEQPFLVAHPFSDGFSLSDVDVRSFTVAPDKLTRLEHEGAALEIDAGALAQTSAIRIGALAADNLPRLEQGMTNVTGSDGPTP